MPPDSSNKVMWQTMQKKRQIQVDRPSHMSTSVCLYDIGQGWQAVDLEVLGSTDEVATWAWSERVSWMAKIVLAAVMKGFLTQWGLIVYDAGCSSSHSRRSLVWEA